MKLIWVHLISCPVEPLRLESPEPPELSPSSRHHQVEHTCLVWSLWFHQSVLIVCSYWVLFSVSILCSPAEVNLRTVWRRQLLHITTPCRQPDLVASSIVVNGLIFGAVALPYSKGLAKGLGHLSASSRILGILVHPFPPIQAYLWITFFIEKIFLGLHTG